MKALELAIDLGMETSLRIERPLMNLSKAETWKLAETIGGDALVSFIRDETHTCYEAITRTFTTGAMAVGNARPAFFVKKAGKSTSQTLKDGNPLCGSGSSQISSPRRAAWNATPRMWCGSF